MCGVLDVDSKCSLAQRHLSQERLFDLVWNMETFEGNDKRELEWTNVRGGL